MALRKYCSAHAVCHQHKRGTPFFPVHSTGKKKGHNCSQDIGIMVGLPLHNGEIMKDYVWSAGHLLGHLLVLPCPEIKVT